jgi:hypothetical protein
MKQGSAHACLCWRAHYVLKSSSAFTLLEVCVAAVILAMIGAQMYQLASVSRQNFMLSKNYIEADKKLYSEIAFARQAAQQYTWCDVLYGIDLDTSFNRNAVVYDVANLNNRSFCADSAYLSSPVSVYRPPLFLSASGGEKCFAYNKNDLTGGVPSSSAIPVEVGTLQRQLNSDDTCTRTVGSAYTDTNQYPDYKPWDLFYQRCRTDMGNNSYDPTGTLYPDQTLTSDPIVGSLVSQLVGHAKANNLMVKQYNNSAVDIKQTHRILLFYSIFYNLNTRDVGSGATEADACAASTESAPLSGCRSITRVVFIDAPVARWCS